MSPQTDLELLVRRVVREELQAIATSRRDDPRTSDEGAVVTVLEFLEQIDPEGKMQKGEAAQVALARFPHLFLR